MKKIKGLLFAFVALFVFTLAMVKVNAAEVSFGVYEVTTTTKERDTATWDFANDEGKPSINTASVLVGGISFNIAGHTGEAGKTIKAGYDATKGKGFLDIYGGASNKKGATVMIPIPAGATSGTITIVGLDSSKEGDVRGLAVNSDLTKLIDYQSAGSTYNFGSTDLTTVGTDKFLELSGVTSVAKKEIKILSIKVVLSDGAFAASAKNWDVKILDGQEVLFDQKMVEGSTLSFKPAKWGYDFEGFCTNPELTTSFDITTPISAATTLYAKFNPWPAGTIKSDKVLDLELIGKGPALTGEDSALVNKLPLGNTFEMLPGASFKSEGKTVGDLGTSTAGIKTGGTLKAEKQTNSLLLHAPSAGTLVLYARSGSGDARTIDVMDNADNKIFSSDPLDNKGPYKLTIAIPGAGDYRIGSTVNSVILSYVEFKEPAVPSITLYQQSAQDGEKELVRYIAIIENIDESQIAGNFSLKLTIEGLPAEYANGFDVTSKCVFAKAITSNGQPYTNNGYTFDAKENVLYAVLVVVVQNDGQNLTNQYNGKTLTATLSVTGFDNMVKTYVVGSLN